jgi:hypothetical protein
MAARASMIWEKLTSGSEGWTVWEDEAISRNPTGIVTTMGTSSSESSLYSWALDFISVCLLMGYWIFIFGSLVTSTPD